MHKLPFFPLHAVTLVKPMYVLVDLFPLALQAFRDQSYRWVQHEMLCIFVHTNLLYFIFPQDADSDDEDDEDHDICVRI